MKLMAAFLKLVRLPNLGFIALTQLLFQFCIYRKIFNNEVPADDTERFILILIASVMIAAAGYIINDYFDINIDRVNKPEKMVVDKVIRRRWAILWHLMLSFLGVFLTALALPVFQKWYILLANIVCVFLLWFYSTSFKKTLLIGNIVISLLVAWTILVLFFMKVGPIEAIGSENTMNYKLFRFAFLYAGFAFIITLIREAIKDIEDMDGDARYGCKTMPIVWGVNATKIYIAVWLIVLIAAISILLVYILQFKWWAAVIYTALAVLPPLVILLLKLLKVKSAADYHKLSNLSKFAMLTGILSMALFWFYL